MSKGWDNATLKKLKALTGKGLSTSEIGKRLGMSKNAIVGKLNRLGWNAKAGGATAVTDATEKKTTAAKKTVAKAKVTTAKKATAPKKTTAKVVTTKKNTEKATDKKSVAKKVATAVETNFEKILLVITFSKSEMLHLTAKPTTNEIKVSIGVPPKNKVNAAAITA